MGIKVTKPEVNIREKLNELTQEQGIKGTEILRADDAQTVRNAIGAGRKNLLINGGFDVWQRGTSSSASTSNEFVADRWLMHKSGGTAAGSRQQFSSGQTDVPGNPKYYHRLDVSIGNNNTQILHKVEDVRSVEEGTYTYSFWAKGTNPGGGTCSFYSQLDFGTGGSTGVIMNSWETYTVTPTWQKFTFTMTVPSMSGKTINDNSYIYTCPVIQPDTDTSTNAWQVDVANVQLELGSVATEFEHRSYGEELALCQRYFEKLTWALTDILDVGNTNRLFIPAHNEWMRANPTVTLTHPSTGISNQAYEFSSGATRYITHVSSGEEAPIQHGYFQLSTGSDRAVYVTATFDAEL